MKFKTKRIYRILIFLAVILFVPLEGYAKPIVRMETTMGNIDIELFDRATPITVKNFLKYVKDGAYDNTIIHRNIIFEPGVSSISIIQGGGFYWQGTEWDTSYNYPSVDPIYGSIKNEPEVTNIRSTIAMAKGSTPDSAANQWFFNVDDGNAANLDSQNGGFTVFGRVMTDAGMEVVDGINVLDSYDLEYDEDVLGNYESVPLTGYLPEDYGVVLPTRDNMVLVNKVYEDVNEDLIDDKEQSHIVSIWNSVDRYVSFYSPETTTITVQETAVDTRVLPAELLPPEGQAVDFVQGAQSVQVTSVAGSAVVSMVLPEGTYPDSRYYIYGPTAENPTDHWYEFIYDGSTGAEINGNIVKLYLIDGGRGDSNPLANEVEIKIGGITEYSPDVNNDGIADIRQYIMRSIGSLNGFVVFSSLEGTTFTRLNKAPDLKAYAEAVGDLSILAFPGNEFINFFEGVHQITVTALADGTASVTIIFPEGANPSAYYIFGPTTTHPSNDWYKFIYDGSTGAEINGNIVTLRIADGGRGDSDLQVNGVVSINLGGAVMATSIEESTVDAGSAGCSLSRSSQDLNGSGAWGFILLFLITLRVYRFRLTKLPINN